jgi:hypothetical protein
MKKRVRTPIYYSRITLVGFFEIKYSKRGSHPLSSAKNEFVGKMGTNPAAGQQSLVVWNYAVRPCEASIPPKAGT